MKRSKGGEAKEKKQMTRSKGEAKEDTGGLVFLVAESLNGTDSQASFEFTPLVPGRVATIPLLIIINSLFAWEPTTMG